MASHHSRGLLGRGALRAGAAGRAAWYALRGTPPVRLAGAVRRHLQRVRVARSVRHLWGEPAVALAPDQATVVCLLRDAEYYLKSFVAHYTRLGARQIVLLDNGSTDRTLELARAYDNVTVLQSRLPYRRFQFMFKEYLLTRFGVGGWRLHADCDELLDYPRSADLPLAGLLRYLNQRGFNAVVAQMLDMFDERLPAAREGAVDHDLRARYPFYDLGGLEQIDYAGYYPENQTGGAELKILRGGIRRTLFGTTDWLTKHPLVRLGDGVVLRDNTAHDVYNARLADVTAVLYHYKFCEGFVEQTARAVREESHHNRSEQYKLYHRVLSATPGLQIRQPGSRRLSGADELVEQGFLVASPAYLAFADAAARRP